MSFAIAGAGLVGGALLGSALGGAKTPNTKGMNQAALIEAEVAREQLDLAKQEQATARERQAAFDPKFMEVINASLASQKTQDDRSAAQWDAYLQDFRPAETRMAETAASYDSQGRRDEAGAAARAAVEREGAMARQAQAQALGRAGVNLSSGRALTLDNASRLQQSKIATGADAAARRAVEATGLSLTDNVVKTGRGIASTGLQAAQLALGAGGTASGTLGQQQGAYNASLAPAQSAYGGAAGAAHGAVGSYGQIAGVQQQAQRDNAAGMAGLGQLAGQLGSAYLLSSKDAKDVVGDVDPEKALDAVVNTPVKAWRYKDGERIEVGPIAETAHARTGLGTPKALSVVSELGQLRGAVQALAKRIDGKQPPKGKPKRRASLGDVEDVSYREVQA